MPPVPGGCYGLGEIWVQVVLDDLGVYSQLMENQEAIAKEFGVGLT